MFNNIGTETPRIIKLPIHCTYTIYNMCLSPKGPSVKISPTKVFMCQAGGDAPTVKNVNLINSSKMPGQYHVQYDWANCPIKCHQPFGVFQNRVQIKLELKPIQIGYYYKRLYILIAYHVRSPVLTILLICYNINYKYLSTYYRYIFIG